MKLSNIAFWISFLRIVLAPAMLLYLCDFPNKSLIICALVCIAAASDFFDGYIARYQNNTSRFGAVLDFTADKAFVLTALLVLSIAGVLPAFITVIILLREVLVMGMRIFAEGSQMQIPASKLGKLKTAVTFLAIIVLLIGYEWNIYIFYVALALTILSFCEYFRNFIKVAKA